MVFDKKNHSLLNAAILDYGVGNIKSIFNMLDFLGAPTSVISEPDEIVPKSSILILPGVGSFDYCLKRLRQSKMERIIKEHLEKEKLLLGICVGAQIMGVESEEGTSKGLGLVDMTCKKFAFQDNIFPVPHVGWGYTSKGQDIVLPNKKMREKFYFTHSYYFSGLDSKHQIKTCTYGFEFASAFKKGNVLGVQFHPEKSHMFGMKFFENILSS